MNDDRDTKSISMANSSSRGRVLNLGRDAITKPSTAGHHSQSGSIVAGSRRRNLNAVRNADGRDLSLQDKL